MRTAPFDAAKRVEQQRCRDLGQGQSADPREQVFFHALDPALGVLLAPSLVLDGVELARDRLERRPGGDAPCQLVQTPSLHGIDSSSMLQPGPIAGVSRVSQADDDLRRARVRIATQGQALLLAIEVVLPEPALGAERRDLEIEASAVGETRPHLARRTRWHCGKQDQ